MDARERHCVFLVISGFCLFPEPRTRPAVAGAQRGFLCTIVLLASALDGIWADGSRNRAGPAVSKLIRLMKNPRSAVLGTSIIFASESLQESKFIEEHTGCNPIQLNVCLAQHQAVAVRNRRG